MVAFLSPRGGRPLSVLMEEIKLYAGMDSLRNILLPRPSLLKGPGWPLDLNPLMADYFISDREKNDQYIMISSMLYIMK